MKKYKTNFPIYNNPFKYYNKKINNNRASQGYPSPDYSPYKYDSKLYDSNMYDTCMNYPNIINPSIYYPNMDYQVPVPSWCSNDREMDQIDDQMAYMKDMYPKICKDILWNAEKVCDEYDYEESFMYDKYPDKEMVLMITDDIYRKMEAEGLIEKSKYKDRDKGDMDKWYIDWYKNLIQVILLNELFTRRQKYYYPQNRGNRYNNGNYKKSFYY